MGDERRTIQPEDPQEVIKRDDAVTYIPKKSEVEGQSNDDMPKDMRGVLDMYNRYSRRYDIDPDEIDRRRVRNKRRRFVAAIGDMGRAVTNLVGTHNWSPNGYDPSKTAAAEVDASNKEAEAEWKERRGLADKYRDKAYGLYNDWQKQRRAEQQQALREQIADNNYKIQQLKLQQQYDIQQGNLEQAKRRQAEIERHNRENERLKAESNRIAGLNAANNGPHHPYYNEGGTVGLAWNEDEADFYTGMNGFGKKEQNTSTTTVKEPGKNKTTTKTTEKTVPDHETAARARNGKKHGGFKD